MVSLLWVFLSRCTTLDINLLIDAIVRQTTVLLAQLATASGTRASVANVANQVFLDLVAELKDRGVGNKVIADMFGMVLRSYHKKVRRLSESATDKGRSLWEAVYSYMNEQETVSQGELMERFRFDDHETVRGVMRDLVGSGLVFRSGRGASAIYRIAEGNDVEGASPDDEGEALANFVWVNVYRMGPLTAADLAKALRLSEEQTELALSQLLSDDRVTQSEESTDVTYLAREFVIPFGVDSGWEAAVFDHFQALVTTITAKLSHGRTAAARSDDVGGSTYAFDLWEGHELETEVLTLFRRIRADASDLRSRVDAYNATHQPGTAPVRVTFYAGQNVLKDDTNDD